MRTHALFLAVLALGIAIRGVVIFAYRPALLFADTNSYLRNARDLSLSEVRPSGYSIFLWPFVHLTDSMMAVQLVQHLIGLLLAVGCYALLVRRGLPVWGATLAVVPLLFDPLQLVLEHYILSDFLFEALLVLACLALLWRRRPGLAAVVAAGALVGTSGLVRGAGTFLLAAFLVAVLCLRLSWVKVVAFLVAAILPMGAYAVAFHHGHGKYAVTKAGPRFLYARVATIVDCQDPQLRLPSYERRLCPRPPIARRGNTNFYMWGSSGPVRTTSFQWHFTPPPGMTQEQVLKDFDKRVVRSQPVAYTRAVLKDFAGGFAPTRTYEVPGYPMYYWRFANHYWAYDTFIARSRVTPKVLRKVDWDPAAAAFMAAYGRWVYLPGPLAAVLLLVAAAATLGLGRARRSGDRIAIGLLAGSCALTLLTGAAFSGFSWRYQLAQMPLLPMAGALGLAALVRGRAVGQPEPAPPLRALDRAAELMTRLPVPAAWRSGVRRAAERGWLQVVLAVIAGLAAAGLWGAAAVGSGWMLPAPAAVIATVVGLVVALVLLVARARARSDSLPGRPPASVGPSTDEPAAHDRARL
ncbi:MAG TPA: hypothetical protein VF165_03350 [Nocardioidaceae bacterium]